MTGCMTNILLKKIFKITLYQDLIKDYFDKQIKFCLTIQLLKLVGYYLLHSIDKNIAVFKICDIKSGHTPRKYLKMFL